MTYGNGIFKERSIDMANGRATTFLYFRLRVPVKQNVIQRPQRASEKSASQHEVSEILLLRLTS